jgi:lactoylglutathione lyase
MTLPRDDQENRPFRILGVQQIALGAEQRADLEDLWIGLLGLQKVGTFRSESENVDEIIAACGHGHAAVEIDLMQPIDATKSPRVHVPALNHIGLWVDNLEKAYAWLQARGVRFAPGGIRKGASGHDVCFIHPKGNAEFPKGGQGVLIELVAAPPERCE